MKRIKFAPNLVQLVLDGTKTSTWRLWDDKDLQTGDIVEFVNAETLEVFSKAELTKVIEKPFKDLTDDEKEGHEKYINTEEMSKKFEEYYHKPVDENTLFKIVHFRLIK
ncbi:MAG: ASCH domain-containing protein [bacterium]|nr:MAG: ASCH domain-containing protein [bacterium]